MRKILSTRDEGTGLIFRLTIGLILLPHGAQKMLGLFGGYGFKGTKGFFVETVPLTWVVGFVVIIIEFVGSLSLVLGFVGRIWAATVLVLMIGIAFSSHIGNGFFMNWWGVQKRRRI
jgi:putative oxidoreductase